MDYLQQMLLILLVIIQIVWSSGNRCRIKEHAPINNIICSINDQLTEGKQNLYLLSYKDMFKINSFNQLVVVNSIDRESLDITKCIPGPEDIVPPYCIINIEIINTSKTQDYQMIQIQIDIEDINDNYPTFDKLNYNIDIDENISPGHTEKLPIARDIDSGINGQIAYSLEGRDKMYFDLIQSNTNKPMIKTLKMFDRETKDGYELILIASDKGNPVRTTEVKLFVRIRDLNDNMPEFNFQKDTVIGVKEDLIEGSKIGDIKVIDKDADSVISVSLDTNVDSDVKKYFQVSGTTGLTLIFRLDYESSLKKFIIPLIAVDNGIPSMTASATLIVNVIDVNDNNPIIKIDSLTDSHTNFKVMENKPKETFIAMVTVEDDDSGINGIIDCSIVEPQPKYHFELLSKSYNNVPQQKRNYKIVTLQEFDREKTSNYQITVQCKDQGHPSLSSQQTITVWIEDENDNPPYFSRQHFQGSMKENSPPGVKIFVLQAVDPDVGKNSHIIYTIHPNYQNLFIINNPLTGIVTNVIPFDRETNKSISFKAFAIDKKNHLLNNSVEVTIEIEDENDCSPIFEPNTYYFKVKEGHTGWIGKVFAYDNDSNSNRQITFVLTGFVRNNLWIVRSDGNIFSERGQLLDREIQTMHHLNIEARDHGSPSHSSSVMIQIQLLDINDNSPKFLQPSDTITINEDMTPGSLITKVTATDDDENENGRVIYSIINTHLFTIDENNGEIYTNKTIERSDYFPRRLIVLARDSGIPRLTATLYLPLTFHQESEEKESIMSNSNSNAERNNQENRKRNFNENQSNFRWNSKEVLISLTVGSVFLILCCAGFLLFYIWYQSKPAKTVNKSNEYEVTIPNIASSPSSRKSEETSCTQLFCNNKNGKPGKPLLANYFPRQQHKQREILQPLSDEQIQQTVNGRNNTEDIDSIINTNSPFMPRYQRQMLDIKQSSDSLNSTLFGKQMTHSTNIYEPPLKSNKNKHLQSYSSIQLPPYNTVFSSPSIQVYNTSKYENQFSQVEQNTNPSKNSYLVSPFAIPNPRIHNSFV